MEAVSPGENPSDGDLVERFRRGHEAAFDELVRRHEGAVRALLNRLAGNEQDAEDMAQETFIRVYRNLERFQEKAALKTWIFRIAMNLFRDFRRRKARRPDPVPLAEPALQGLAGGGREAPLGRLTLGEKERAVIRALEGLPFQQRAALIMKVREGMRYEEIAAVLDTTPGSVKSSIHVARKKLMKDLGDFS